MKSLPLMGRGRRVVAVNKSKTKAAKKPRKRPGQRSEVLEDGLKSLKIEGNWKDAMRKLISKKRLVGGWPND